METNNQKNNSSGYTITLVVGAILLIGAGAYLFLGREKTPTQDSSLTATQDKIENWKTYTNKKAKVSFRYPLHWTVKEEQPDGESKRIAITGKEGKILLDYGAGFGGMCPSGYETFSIGNAQTQACRTTPDDGSEKWSLSTMKKGNSNFNAISYSGFVTANAPYKDTRGLVLQILSTFTFTK